MMRRILGKVRRLMLTHGDPAESRACRVSRFTDTHYEPAASLEEIAQRIGGVREIQPRTMSFRAIFLALAKARRAGCV